MILLIIVVPLWAQTSVQVAPPTLPSAGYDTQAEVGEPADTSGYTRVTVPTVSDGLTNGTALQTAITAASCGTVLLLTPGAVYDGGTKGLQLPAKNCPSGRWVVIRSAAPDAQLPAAGVRIAPSYAAQLPRIVTSQANVAAIKLGVASNNYLLEFLDIGLNTTALQGKDSSAALIDIGDGTYGNSCLECKPADEPTNIVVDRDLIRGSDTPPIGIRRGVDMACSRCAVINSYVDQIHEIGFDSQAIEGWNSTGPWLVDNSFLEAAAENLMVGGAPSNMGQNPSDLTITHNYFYKPMSWDPNDPSYAGNNWSIKNLLELKSGVRVLVEGNVFQNCWTSGQSGRAIAINPAGDENLPWVTDSDLTIAYNKFDNTQGFVEPGDVIGGPAGVEPTRIAIHDNLATNQGAGAGFDLLGISDDATGTMGVTSNVEIAHNTVLLSLSAPHVASSGFEFESLVAAGETPLPNWDIRNNIFERGTYGVHANCSVAGLTVPCFTAEAWLNNMVYDTAAGGGVDWCSLTNASTIYAVHAAACPVADVAAVGFVNAAGGDFHLATTSPGYRKATDGSDVGANIDLLNTATAGVAP